MSAGGPTSASLDLGAPSRPMRKDAARNREALIAAARVVFARRGLEASLDEVAKEAGVGVGTAYRHFANKFELAEAIMLQAFEQVLADAERAADTDDPWQGLVGLVTAILELQTRDRGLREVMMGMHNAEQTEQFNRRIEAPISRLIERARAAGAVRADLAVTDLGVITMMACQVADLLGDAEPQLWRRYLPGLLAMFREPSALDSSVAPIDDERFRRAVAPHKHGHR